MTARPGQAPATKSLLVVDEDAGLARALQILLEDERPFTVRVATSVAQALQCLADHPGVEAVICDPGLPGGGEPGLADLLLRRQPGLAVIALTAHAPTPAWRQWAGQEAGATLLRKPVDPGELLAALDRLLAGGSGAPGS